MIPVIPLRVVVATGASSWWWKAAHHFFTVMTVIQHLQSSHWLPLWSHVLLLLDDVCGRLRSMNFESVCRSFLSDHYCRHEDYRDVTNFDIWSSDWMILTAVHPGMQTALCLQVDKSLWTEVKEKSKQRSHKNVWKVQFRFKERLLLLATC